MTTTHDYYTPEMLDEIWSPTWFDSMFRHGSWCSGTPPITVMKPITPSWQCYHPHGCHACKRGEALTWTPLLTCTSCRVVKYCSREHQKHDWQFHKQWCQAFAKLREEVDMNKYESREEWRQSMSSITSQLSAYLPTMRLHSTEIQIAIAQPRCRKCFKAGMDRQVKLTTCPRCMGVALCSDCLKEDAPSAAQPDIFHCDTENPLTECDGHLISICCTAMIVEQGNPLGLPSNTDRPEYWKPQDWREYFRLKSNDYELPSQLFSMAPVAAFITDAHSTTLTIQHVLSLPELGIEASHLTKMVVYIVGAAIDDKAMLGRYVEMLRLNPKLTDFQIHLIGPSLSEDDDEVSRRALHIEKIRSSCSTSIKNHQGLYHEIANKLESEVDPPNIVICPHSGMHDPSYTESWRSTIEMLSEKGVPVILTGYNHKEVLEDTALLRKWGASVIVPPTFNPFRGLRPYIDPNRDPDDFYFRNASFVVMRGRSYC